MDAGEEVFVRLSIDGVASVGLLADRACAKFPRWGAAANAGQVHLYLVTEERARALHCGGSADDILAGDSLFPSYALERAGVIPGSWLLARVSQPAAAAASLEDLLVASGMRREEVRSEVVRRAYMRYGGAVAAALAGAGRPEVASDVYALAARQAYSR